VLFCIFSYYMLFVNTGRAGYVIYFALSILALIQYLEAKQIVAGILCFCSVFAIFSYQSPVISQGISSVFTEVKQYQQGQKLTSVGFRFTFHEFAKSLFLSSPWIGQGTGGFSYAFQKENQIPQWNNLLDPHSQYWLVASELGLLGLAALFAFFVSLWVTALRLHDMKPILLGTLVAHLLGNLSDSLLFYAAGGHLFVIMSALCLGELVENHERVMDANPVFLEGKTI
jgi:O-antigen ligase